MADTKITALTALTAADPANDVLPIVDVSDTTMAASGTTKKISVNNILGASGTATLASATITGDLTVDTSTLKVDSANNRVGVVNASPSFALDVNGAGSGVSARISSGSGTGFRFDTTRNVGGLNRNYLIGCDVLNEGWFSIVPSTALGGGTFTNSIYNASYDGTHTWNDGAGSERMRLNSTGLGVGGSPSYKLDVQGTSAGVLRLVNILNLSTDPAAVTRLSLDGQGATWHLDNERTNGIFKITRNSTTCLTIDNSANVGIGVTPAGTGGCLQLKSGITFPATQVASSDANTLDDYEEGTFTPTIIGTSTAGTGTYSVQSGTYTKVGRLVSCQIFLNWTAHTGTGDMRISGLPFQVSGASNYFAAATIGYLNNVSLSAGNIATGYAINSTSVITLGQYPTGGGAAAGIAMDTSGEILISVNYVV